MTHIQLINSFIMKPMTNPLQIYTFDMNIIQISQTLVYIIQPLKSICHEYLFSTPSKILEV